MTVATVGATPRPNLLSILRFRNFALLWVGQAISQLGDQIFSVALLWLVLQLTNSALAVATISIFGQLSRLVFQLIGGVSVDRYDRRLVMLVSDALRGILVLVFALLVATNQIQMLHVYVFAVIYGIVMAFFSPARSALIPNLVPKEGLIAANSLSGLTQQLMQVVGPALAGILIATPTIGIAGVSFLNAASFGAGVIGLLLMQISTSANTTRKAKKSFWRELGEGFRYLFGFRALAIIMLLSMILNFAFAPFFVLMPVFAKTALGLGSEGYGLLVSVLTAGLVIGSLVIGARAPHAHRGILAFSLMALDGLLFVGVGTIPIFAVTVTLLMLSGFLNAIISTMFAAVMQEIIVDEFRGRVFSVGLVISAGLAPLAIALGGALGDALGAGVVLAAGGVLTTLTALSGLLFREIRALE